MRVAIACSGLGRIRRGFETFSLELFRQLTHIDDLEVVLFKGGGDASPDEVPLWSLPRASSIWQLARGVVNPYIGEQVTFGLSLSRKLRKHRVDVVHLSDGQLASILIRLVPRENRPFRIVYSNGGPLGPSHYARFDFIQQVNPVEFESAVTYGIPRERMTLLPYGIATEKYGGTGGKSTLQRMGISGDQPVVLTVGAHGAHKRLDFLLSALSVIEKDFHLLVVGEEAGPETHRLRSLARKTLGDRVTFAKFPHKDMASVYAAADIFLLASLREGLPLTLLEAMASRLPILHHDEPAMNWVLGETGIAVDMAEQANIAEAVRLLLNDSDLRMKLGQAARERAQRAFSWSRLIPDYLAMYRRALELSPALQS